MNQTASEYFDMRHQNPEGSIATLMSQMGFQHRIVKRNRFLNSLLYRYDLGLKTKLIDHFTYFR